MRTGQDDEDPYDGEDEEYTTGRISVDRAELTAFGECLARLPYRPKHYSFEARSCELQYIHNEWLYVVELIVTRRGGLFNRVQEVHRAKVQLDAETGDIVGIRVK